MDYKIFWSEESLYDLENILSYLEQEWTEKEIKKFKNTLGKQIELISANPLIFPASEYLPNLRKAVLSKHTTIFYEIRENEIYIAHLFSNRMDIRRIQ